MLPITPDKFFSHRERRDRDVVMGAVRHKIARDRLPCDRMIIHGRSMSTAIRARILRGEWETVSLRQAYLYADAAGVEIEMRAAA